MPENNNSNLAEENSGVNETNKTPERADRFESDTQKLVRRHLEDPDHQITDEEMQNMRVGMSPTNLDEATEARLKGDDAIEEVEEKELGDRNIEEDENTSGDKITPWDTIDPK